MASRRPSGATAFIVALSLGALAVATVAVALTFTASAAQRIRSSERDASAVDLLEQRYTVANLIAAEQAAAVVDMIDGAESMATTPITSQRITALDTAEEQLDEIATRAGSVGNEAQRWLAAVRGIEEPASIADPLERLIAYDTAFNVACCAGVVPAEEHHTGEVTSLEDLASQPPSVWQYFYLDVERASRQGPGIPEVVSQFMNRLEIPSEVAADTPVPSVSFAQDLESAGAIGPAQEAINSLTVSDAMHTLDSVVLNVANRSSVVVTVDEAYAAADAAQRALDEMVAGAIESAHQRLADRIESARQVRLVTRIIAPLLLVVLVCFGFVAYRFGRSRSAARQREQDLLDNRNRFMRMVSHELRTPATAISGFTEMLSNDWTALTEAEIAEFLAIIHRQSTHLSLLVDDLLTLSHLETGRLRLHLGVVNLSQAATEAINLVDTRYGVDIETTIDPAITVIADPDRLVQVIRNLVENAAKYGKVGVGVSAAVVGSGCDVAISDRGTGVPPDMVPRIFRFWDRGDKDGSRARGYGMGLAIARHLARAMVGDLVYRPNHPVGSEFILSLPLGPPDVNELDKPRVKAAQG
jgi:signal transduction histidine kinase